MTETNMDPVTPSRPATSLASASPASYQAARRPGPQPLLAPGLGHVAPGSVRRLLVLAVEGDRCCAVDLETGALLSARSTSGPHPRLAPYEVALGTIVASKDIPDPAQPEGVDLEGPITPAPGVRRRQLRSRMRDQVTPSDEALLGFPGQVVPYWTLTGAFPSMALIRPEGSLRILVRPGEVLVRVSFPWGGLDHELPVYDFGLATTLSTALAGRRELSERPLEQALGYRPHYALVTLTPPRGGQCYKTIAALLAKP